MLICGLCLISILLSYNSMKHSDLSMPLNVETRYTSSPYTGHMNLQRHLYQVHTGEYNKEVLERNWPYKLSSKKVGLNAQSIQGSS